MTDGVEQAWWPPEIELSGGSWVKLRDGETLTGRDVKDFRKAVYGGDGGDRRNATSSELARLFVMAWEIAYAPNLPLPKDDPDTYVDVLTARDLLKLENTLAPILVLLLNERSDARPAPFRQAANG